MPDAATIEGICRPQTWWFRVIGGVGLSLAVGCGGGGDMGTAAHVPPLMQDWGAATPLGGTGVLTYAFAVAPADLAQLNATAIQEIYVPADLTVSGQVVGRVGLRYKGSDGTLGACVENGVIVCPKLSFKVKFDLADPDRRLTGLKQLNLHSMLGDPSLMRERLAYELFRRMDIAGPRATHAFVTINGEARGVFGAVEELDGGFTKDRWKEAGDGNLYKEAWPIEVNAENYTPLLATNEKMPDNQLMAMFADALYRAKLPELPAVIARFADPEQLLRFMAVDDAINNYDGVTAFYCDQTGKDCSNHNFYWYQHPTLNRFLLVPWDLTDTFSVSTLFDAVPAWNVVPADCGARSIVEGGAVARPGCDLVFRGIAGAGRPAYDAALDRMLEVWDVGALTTQLRTWSDEIAPAVARDPAGPGLPAWRAAVAQLEETLTALRERLLRLRAATAPETFGLTAPGQTDFEGTSALALQRGASSDANPHSGKVLRLEATGGLAGARDLRFDFEFANEPGVADPAAAAPWAIVRLPITGATADLRGIKHIRLLVASDAVRTVRFELDSAKYGVDPEEGARYGKDTLIGKQTTEVTIAVGELRLPSDRPGPVSLDDVLSEASALLISPQARGRAENGLLGAGKTDPGFVRIDGIAFE